MEVELVWNINAVDTSLCYFKSVQHNSIFRFHSFTGRRFLKSVNLHFNTHWRFGACCITSLGNVLKLVCVFVSTTVVVSMSGFLSGKFMRVMSDSVHTET